MNIPAQRWRDNIDGINLEQISNENLVNFYKREFKLIGLGEPASTFFTQSVRRRLIKKGMLSRSRARVDKGPNAWITTISDMTRTLISQLEQ